MRSVGDLAAAARELGDTLQRQTAVWLRGGHPLQCREDWPLDWRVVGGAFAKPTAPGGRGSGVREAVSGRRVRRQNHGEAGSVLG